MQWPVKARGCQHLSFLNHDIGNQILAVYPERGHGGVQPAEPDGSPGYPLQGTVSALYGSRQARQSGETGEYVSGDIESHQLLSHSLLTKTCFYLKKVHVVVCFIVIAQRVCLSASNKINSHFRCHVLPEG